MSNQTYSSGEELFLEDGYFGFKPILGLEIAAIVLYIILTVIALVINIMKRSWFMNPIALVRLQLPF
jgi:hypothetical protein